MEDICLGRKWTSICRYLICSGKKDRENWIEQFWFLLFAFYLYGFIWYTFDWETMSNCSKCLILPQKCSIQNKTDRKFHHPNEWSGKLIDIQRQFDQCGEITRHRRCITYTKFQRHKNWVSCALCSLPKLIFFIQAHSII